MLKSKIVLLSGAAFITLGVSACSIPHGLPTGYTHHGKVYKSATPPSSPRVTDAQRAHMGAAQAEQFRTATYDILTRLTSRAGVPPKPVYVEAASPMTPFYANIDNDLREALRSQSYRLSDTADGAYIIKYNAELLPGYRSYDLEKAETGAPNIKLTMDVLTNVQGTLKMLTQEEGHYYIEGAEGLLIPVPYQKYQPVEHETRSHYEAGMEVPRTGNVHHSDEQLRTIQPVMDKTEAPVVDIIEAPSASYVEPAEPMPMEPVRVSEPMLPTEPMEYVVTEPSAPDQAPAVQIFDLTTSEPVGSYDYSASMNDMTDGAPVRRGLRVSKQVEY
ncbi:MAG: hypothetical protein HRT94_03085 [Alphaproteobacteria bacterium]|nr:hypothetical protein [Alphaproteobacteria bacterium]